MLKVVVALLPITIYGIYVGGWPALIVVVSSIVGAVGTEALWQALPHEGQGLIAAEWPTEGWVDDEAEAFMQSLMDVVRAIRNARVECNIQAGKRIPAVFVAGDMTTFYELYKETVCNLAHLDQEAVAIAESVSAKPAQARFLFLM